MPKTADRGASRREPLLDIPSTAAFLGVSTKTIRRWIAAGDLRAAKLGGQWRMDPRDLDHFFRDRLAR